MSTKKEKTKAAAKRRPTSEARKTKPKLAGHGRGPEGPTGRFWTQWIEPRGAAVFGNFGALLLRRQESLSRWHHVGGSTWRPDGSPSGQSARNIRARDVQGGEQGVKNRR